MQPCWKLRSRSGHQSNDFVSIGLTWNTPSGSIPEAVERAHAVEVVVENADVLGGDERRMLLAAGVAQLEQLLPQRDNIIRQAGGLDGWVQSRHQPLVLRGDSRGAMSRVTFQRLNATNGDHCFPRDLNHVDSHRERDESTIGEAEFAAAEEGFTAVKHQREVGAGYFDQVLMAITAGKASTAALVGSTEEAQFH